MEESRGKADVSSDDITDHLNFLPKPLLTVLGSTVCLIFLVILLIVPAIQLGIGAAYRDQCTINTNIPVYLIVSGACGVASVVLMLVLVVVIICLIKGSSGKTTFVSVCLMVSVLVIIILLSIFLFAWLIVGSVWVFGAKPNVVYDDSTSSNYCQRTLYDFAFVILIISYAMCGLSCFCTCLGSCVKAIIPK